MKQVIAMHGWCSDSNKWAKWKPYFIANKWFWQSGERGYGQRKPLNPSWVNDTCKGMDTKRVLICHSLGTHLISKEIYSKATDIVLLNSFSRFLPTGKENRALKIGLLGMQKHLEQSSMNTMLLSFLEKANSPHSINQIPEGPIQQGITDEGKARLQSDLNLLINTSSLPKGLSKNVKVLVINGDQDRILLPITINNLLKDLNKYLNKEPENWTIEGQGHSIISSDLIIKVRAWLES
ncbi:MULTISPECIES: hypothetical protein [Prochlorococcus]|uniref:hypothetical protein n=1 Tax=Prochlorococcus TaxID=1218 RepID=UPI000533B893|nr:MULTISPECIES: hypothetical protein [Prochlorococcus]KGG13498.1 Biotin synthesis protein bioK [Prochlorococcus sp. MIT 0601]